jgi:hypothetical protein
MALITIQQAYALAYGVYTEFDNSVLKNRGSLSSAGLVTRASSLKTNKLDALLVSARNAGALDLDDITYINKDTGSSTTILTNANDPDNNTYALVSSTVNQNGGSTFDYLEGSSSIDTTTGTLSTFESNLHKTGRVIFNKLKK